VWRDAGHAGVVDRIKRQNWKSGGHKLLLLLGFVVGCSPPRLSAETRDLLGPWISGHNSF
jgi:hypothetical protein